MTSRARNHGAPGGARLRITLLGCLLSGALVLPAPAQAPPDETSQALVAPAAELELTHEKRRTTGGAIEQTLSPSVRSALNDWAGTIADLDLSVVVPTRADALVLGTADHKVLVKAAAVLDDTWELLGDLAVPPHDEPAPATLAFLFDVEGMRSQAWADLIAVLADRRLIPRSAQRALAADPAGLTLRQAPLFLQPTFDMAGDASAGDDEFRLSNELAHKLTVCTLRTRIGEVPASIRWGLGYLVEQRLFRSIYQFDHTGFVRAEDHFQWPKRTSETLKKAIKQRNVPLARHALDESSAGRATTPQLVTWGTLDYLHHEQPEVLLGMLTELAALHGDATGALDTAAWAGDADAAREVVERHLAEIDPRKLLSHVKRVK